MHLLDVPLPLRKWFFINAAVHPLLCDIGISGRRLVGESRSWSCEMRWSRLKRGIFIKMHKMWARPGFAFTSTRQAWYFPCLAQCKFAFVNANDETGLNGPLKISVDARPDWLVNGQAFKYRLVQTSTVGLFLTAALVKGTTCSNWTVGGLDFFYSSQQRSKLQQSSLVVASHSSLLHAACHFSGGHINLFALSYRNHWEDSWYCYTFAP